MGLNYNHFAKIIGSYIGIGVSTDISENVKHKIMLANGYCVICQGIVFMFTLLDTIRLSPLEVIIDLCIIGLFTVPPIFNKLGKHKIARMLVISSGNFSIFLTCLFLGSGNSLPFLFTNIFAISLAIFDTRSEFKIIIIAILLTLTTLAVVMFLPTRGLISGAIPGEELLYPLNLLFCCLSLSALITYYNVTTGLYIKEVAKQFANREMELKQLGNVAKFAALGQLAAGLAHEINNPLAIIQGRAQILGTMVNVESFNGETLARHTQSIVETTQRISKITKGMLAFARSDKPTVTTIDAIELINKTIDICKETLQQKNIQISAEIAPGIFLIGEFNQLQQVLMNLITNARDALSDEGREAPHAIFIKVYSQENQAIIDVIDSGPGIPESVAERIMEPFFTTKGVGKGTGLGLSLSKGLLEANGGHLVLARKSHPTTFRILLPQAEKMRA